MDAGNFFRTANDQRTLEWILIINTIVVAVYLIVHLLGKQKKKGGMLSVFMLFMPVVGPLYLLCSWFLRFILSFLGYRSVNLDELSFNKARVRQFIEADAEKERDMVPLEETRILSGKEEKRQTFLEMIKGDEVENIGSIRNAVADQDQEIAHYAASYLTDVLARTKQKEVSLRNAFENNQTTETCESYVRHLRQALSMGIFEGVERRRYLERLDDAYTWLMDHDRENCAVDDMTALMRQWMQINDMIRASQWFDRMRSSCYEDLGALKACAVFYYRTHDRDALLRLLSEVRDSELELDSEALEWIRFFRQPVESCQAKGVLAS